MATLFKGGAALPFDADAAMVRLRKADKKLGELFDLIGPFALKVHDMPSPFEALAESIVYQQLTGRAAATIFGRVRALSGQERFLTPAEVLALPDDALRGAGLSRGKAAALRDLAARTLDGAIPAGAALFEMADEEVVERLVAVRGIGRWTVEMLLIFRLGRPDVLPIDDYGLRKGFMRTFGGVEVPRPKEVAARGDRWRPFRTVASWYLWRASERKD
ncbi:MAG: DNA-3-methyladenine glycosylase 2 family protein [Candidatus Sericytochromatia bacterium]|uniref:DNA-3-methyladenine glycosylase II n=1 Tax=Candidatus Tanganyikabacteria bacterium TaxID=2961651 RepID=A0A938BMJ4_9BACT|nr:DNA-3-methyladenine glycosylase 2 family protein [Candidatus Tanganyikabacteria bacterium]